MIIRIFRAQVHSQFQSEFETRFHEVSVPLVKSQKGLVSVSIGKPTRWAPDEYVMVSIWDNTKALEDFAGQAWNKPVIPHGMEKFIVECWVHHYEEF